MEIQDFRTQVEAWPRNQRGRLILSDSKKNLIGSVFRSSGLAVADFCLATGLKVVTVSKLTRGTKNVVRRRRKSAKPGLFQAVKVIPTQEESSWSVYGPKGLEVKCNNLSQLTQLWRALC